MAELSKPLKTACFIFFVLITFLYFYQSFAYAACPGVWLCDNTPMNSQKECGESTQLNPPLNGSFSGASGSTKHFWNTTVNAPYANVTVSITGQTGGATGDTLDLRLYDPFGNLVDEDTGGCCGPTYSFRVLGRRQMENRY